MTDNPCMTTETAAHVLSLSRLIPVERATLWRCWTEPGLLKQWFCPRPWTVAHAEMELRAGGSSLVVMRGPEGEEMPHRGVYLEVVPQEKIVFTDAFVRAWVPSGKAFMVGTITFADEAGGTRYVAEVGHWSDEDRRQHEAMGFHQGWGTATDQLAALASTL
jgi:uncharacterized protein YndB with AHSA1/START domain